MPESETQCRRTCRDNRPDDPDTWCPGCVAAEAEAREANWARWRERVRREVLERWTARLETAQ